MEHVKVVRMVTNHFTTLDIDHFMKQLRPLLEKF